MSSWLALVAWAAADFSGIWMGQLERPNNEPLDVAFQLTQKGGQLTGKQYDDYKSPVVMEGKVVGDTMSFVVVMAEQAGNEIRQTRYRYTGKLAGGEIEMTREREAMVNAANGASVQPGRNGTKQTFRLRRLGAGSAGERSKQ